MADELVEIVDDAGVVERVVTRAEMRAGNLRHRSVYIVVRHGPRLLVHRRASWKDVWPSYWDLAFGGVLAVGEDWLDGARRELGEEAGIDVPAGAFTNLGPLTYDSVTVRVRGRVYGVEHEGPFTFPDGEVEEALWIAAASLPEWLNGRDVCPDSKAGVVPLIR